MLFVKSIYDQRAHGFQRFHGCRNTHIPTIHKNINGLHKYVSVLDYPSQMQFRPDRENRGAGPFRGKFGPFRGVPATPAFAQALARVL